MSALGFMLGTAVCRARMGVSRPSEPGTFERGSATEESFTLVWEEVPEGVVVRIECQASGGDWSALSGSHSEETFPYFELHELTANTLYDLRIRAEHNGLYSNWVTLNEVYTLPARPTGLAAEAGEPGKIDFTWDPLPAGCTASLYMNGVATGIVGLTGTSYSFEDVEAGSTSTFILRSVSDDSGLESNDSEPVEGTSGAAPPANLTAPVIDATGGNASPSSSLFVQSAGTWTGGPTSFTYMWYSFDTANWSQTFITTEYLMTMISGYTYRVGVTATNEAGVSEEVFSNSIFVNDPA